MKIYTTVKDDFIISTGKTKLNIALIHNYLSNESYWAKNIPLNVVKKSINGSCYFGLYMQKDQIGFARVVTDHATFGYIADVFFWTSTGAKD
jgi:hypothetical protein